MSASAENSTSIVIDLDHSDSNTKLEVNQLVQHQSYSTLAKRIKTDLDSAKKLRQLQHASRIENEYPYGSGLVYFIDGTRGAGKSTFLQSAFDALGNEKTEPSVSRLAYIDPSRIEHSEIILLSI